MIYAGHLLLLPLSRCSNERVCNYSGETRTAYGILVGKPFERDGWKSEEEEEKGADLEIVVK
jgi:hypothetical protein